MNNLLNPTTLDLRLGRLDDSDDILAWRNDPQTRAMSRTHDPVSVSQHQPWFKKALGDPDQLIIMGECESGKIGVVRFSKNPQGWEVGINLNPTMRGQGWGLPLLTQAIERFCAHHPGQTLLAVIRPDNPASQKIFSGAGFKWVKHQDEYDHYRWEQADGDVLT